MDTVKNIGNTIINIENVVERNVKTVLAQPYIMALLKVSLVLYASQIAPRVPGIVQSTLSNTFVKIMAIALIAYFADVDFQLAIILALIFVLGANLMSGRGVFESYENNATYFSDQTKYTNLLGQPAIVGKSKLIDSSSDNYPGCNDVTMKDLLNLFDGDKEKLQNNVSYAFYELNQSLKGDAKAKLITIAKAVGLPYNIQYTDANAGLIATVLLNQGYKVSESCQVPQQ